MSAFGALTGIAAVTAEAEGPDGAHVTFAVQVEGGNDGSDGRPADTVTCTPPSGSLFPLGMTTVSCVGSEGSTGSFVVTVVDWTAPALTLPRDFTVVTTSPSGEAVSYTATAFDLVDGSVAITCTPPSGSTFPLGTTAVTCTASDAAGNTASDGFNITVATTPPPPGNPDIVAEATSADGAYVVFDTGDEEGDDGRPGSGGCSPAPGSLFPLGETTVTCPSGNFIVSVVDTTPPALDLPGTITTQDTTVTYTATATDLVDGNVAITCTPPSGSTFPLGTTTVNCSATDSRDNTATGSFQIVVTTGPVGDPDDITAEATGASGAIVTFDLGSDAGGRPITCSPSSESTFPLGDTEVTCSNGATFTVTIVDTTPPVLSLPANMTVEATSAAGAIVTFTTTSLDLVDGSVPVICTPPSGSTFALGTTTVNCSATDAHDNTSSGSFSVTVVDTTPPDITSVTVTPATIWPPNKKLVNVT
ncbi:HYR domain-containing protein, partial [Candidatus Uhrbacteria bacterium]|nr:HYR domain-containing protein [Candidatus Uhrbacteria bacterium]